MLINPIDRLMLTIDSSEEATREQPNCSTKQYNQRYWSRFNRLAGAPHNRPNKRAAEALNKPKTIDRYVQSTG